MQKYFYIFDFPIYYYGIISAIGYLVGVIVTCINAKKRGFTTDDIVLCACYIIPLAIIGARLCFVIFNPNVITSFWDIFNLRDGGLVFYGGLIGGIVGVVLYCLIHKKNFLKLADIVVLGLILGQGIGRWGNFVNGEAYGFQVTNPSFQFFPIAIYADGAYHLATFFYEFVNNVIIYIILQTLICKVHFKHDGTLAHIYLIAYGACRFVVEGLRVDCVMLGIFKFSQVTSVLMILYASTYLITQAIITRKKEKKNPYNIIMNVLKNDL